MVSDSLTEWSFDNYVTSGFICPSCALGLCYQYHGYKKAFYDLVNCNSNFKIVKFKKEYAFRAESYK
jgi:hypothetical protein